MNRIPYLLVKPIKVGYAFHPTIIYNRIFIAPSCLFHTSLCKAKYFEQKKKQKAAKLFSQKETSNRNQSRLLDDEDDDIDIAKRSKNIDMMEVLDQAKNDMKVLEEKLGHDLIKHFSLKLDLRTYEEINVVLENGTKKPLGHLSRITLLNPKMIQINFADNPSVIGPAKLAIQRLFSKISPIQEGIVLNIPIPRMTRERREELIKSADKIIFNQYKLSLNKIYTNFDELVRKHTEQEEGVGLLKTMRELRKKMEEQGSKLVEAKKKELMKEIT